MKRNDCWSNIEPSVYIGPDGSEMRNGPIGPIYVTEIDKAYRKAYENYLNGLKHFNIELIVGLVKDGTLTINQACDKIMGIDDFIERNARDYDNFTQNFDIKTGNFRDGG